MSKCAHGVYGDGWGCQQCHQPNWQDSDKPAPVLPRSSADPLNADKSSKLETCTNCGNVRTYSLPDCRFCGTPFPPSNERGRTQGAANAHQTGACPDCGSTVHYETEKKSVWCCADCGTEYKATKRKADPDEH